MTARRVKGDYWVDFYWMNQHGPKVGIRERIRRKSPINTKRGAEDYERLLRTRLMEGKPLDGRDPTTKVAPLFGTYATEWLDVYVKTNNKPSTWQI